MVITVQITELHFHQLVANAAQVFNLETGYLKFLRFGIQGEIEIIVYEGLFGRQGSVNIGAPCIGGRVFGRPVRWPEAWLIDYILPDLGESRQGIIITCYVIS